jgi:hypothetical protein
MSTPLEHVLRFLKVVSGVVEHIFRAVTMHDHVRLPIAVDILKRDGDRGLIGLIPFKLCHDIQVQIIGTRYPGGDLKHFNQAMIINGDEVRQRVFRGAMSDVGLHLRGTRKAVMEKIHPLLPQGGNDQGEHNPKHNREHQEHEQKDRCWPPYLALLLSAPGWRLIASYRGRRARLS